MTLADVVRWMHCITAAQAVIAVLAVVTFGTVSSAATPDRAAVVAAKESAGAFAPGLTELKWKTQTYEQTPQGWEKLVTQINDYDILLVHGGEGSATPDTLPQTLLGFMEAGGAVVVTGVESTDAVAWVKALDEKTELRVNKPEKPAKAPDSVVHADQNWTLLTYPTKASATDAVKAHFTLSGPGGRDWRIVGRRGTDNQPCVIARHFGKGILILSTAHYQDAAFLGNVAKLLELQRMGVAFVRVTHSFNDADKFAFGKGITQIALENLTDGELAIQATLSVVGADASRTYKATNKTERRGRLTVDIPLLMDVRGPSEVTITLSDIKETTQAHLLTFPASGPAFLEIDPPTYRGMISAARRDPAVRFDLRVNPVVGEDVEGLTIRASVISPQGNVISEKDLTASGAGLIPVSLPLPADAAPGTYTLSAKVVKGRVTPESASATFKIVPVRPGQMFVDQDGVLLNEGKPFFPIGLYHVTPGELDAAARTGINMVQFWFWDASPENMAKLKEKGLLAIYEDEPWAQIVHNHVKNPKHFDFEVNPKFKANVERVRDDPSQVVRMWYTADEPSYGMIPHVKRIRDYWHALDEDRPTYIVSTGDPRLHEGADVLGVDVYPVYLGRRRSLSNVGDYMDGAKEGVRHRKPVIAVLQSFGYNERHHEKPEEVRAMSYLALTHGVQGIFWYCWKETGDRTGVEGAGNHPETIKVLTDVIAETKVVAPALLEPGRRTMKSADGRVHAILAGNEKTGRFLVYVNAEYEPCESTLVVPELANATLEPLFGAPAGKVVDGKLTLKLPPLATGVYRINTR